MFSDSALQGPSSKREIDRVLDKDIPILDVSLVNEDKNIQVLDLFFLQ